MKKTTFLVAIVFLLWGKYIYAACIQNNFLGANAEISSGVFYGFDLGTASSYSPANGRLIYKYTSACFEPSSTSHIVAKVDNIPCDFYSATIVGGTYTTTSDEMWGTHRFNNVVDIEVHFKFVNNPSTGINADTLQYKFIARNIDSIMHNVALRLELDTMVLGNDGTNISIDNGFTVLTANSIWYKTNGDIPANWWDYDIDPHFVTPTLIGRGHVHSNPYGEQATQPDIFEVAYWPFVNRNAQWTTAGAGSIGSDSAVVLWWCNGSPSSSGFQISPGQSITWITYYGLNQGALLTTPTITQTLTITPTQTMTPTITQTLTITPTQTMTQTITQTVTITQTRTITPTFTITQTSTITPTETITPTITPTLVPFVIELKGSFPNPFQYDTSIIFYLSREADCSVKIFTVSGEVVLEESRFKGYQGYNKFYWNGCNKSGKKVSSGVFIYRIKAITEYDEKGIIISKTSCVR